MKLPNSKHECKYWETNIRHYYRYCKYCRRKQYNYSGNWEDEIILPRFLGIWTSGMGGGCGDCTPYLRIDISFPFEQWSHESWDTAYTITFMGGKYAGQTFGPFRDFNQANVGLKKAGLEPFWEWERDKKD